MASWLHQGKHDKYFALADSIGRSFARLAVNVLIARLAGAEVFAVFVVMLTLEMIWTTLVNAGLLTPIITVSPNLAREEQAGLVAFALRRVAVMSFIAGVLLILVASWFPLIGLGIWTWAGFTLATCLQSINHTLRAWRSLTFTSWNAFWADAIGLSLPIISVAACGFFLDTTWVLFAFWWSSVLGQLIGAAVLGGCDTVRLLRRTPIRVEEKRRLRGLGIAMGLGSAAYSAGSRLQPIVLTAVSVGLEVSRFGAAITLIGPLRMLTVALSGVVRPRFGLYYGRGEESRARRLAFNAILFVTLIAVSLLGLLISFGDHIGSIVFGEWMTGIKTMLLAATFYAWLECVGSVLVTALQSQDDRGAADVTRLRIAASVIALAAMWPVCSGYGAAGAFTAMACIEAGFVVCCIALWRRRSQAVVQAADACGA